MSDILTTAPTTLALTLADAKRHLNVSTTNDDAIITSHLKAATLLLENKANRCFVTQTRTLKMDNFVDMRYVHGRRIYPMRSPLKSVSSITYLDSAGASQTLASSDYIVSTGDKPGYIAEAYNATWPATYPQKNAITVTYIAGHSTVSTGVPENCKQAVRMVTEHFYRNRGAVLTGTISKEIEFGIDALMEQEYVEQYG